MRFSSKLFAAILFAAFMPTLVWGEAISAAKARRAVERWTAHRPAEHLHSHMNRPVKNVRTIKADGEDAFHVVELEGGGFVVTATDDSIAPIVAFSDEGTLVEDEKNPLWVMLNLDLPQRMKAHRSGKLAKRDRSQMRGRGRHQRWKEPDVEWQELTAADDGLQTQTTATLSSISDIRVSPLIQSTWDQLGVSGGYCYNYYTPTNYYCGCVATAGAQLMRYWQFPTKSVTASTQSCWVNDVATSKKMMGGTYDWANMPLKPSSSITDTQRKAIGKLCYDVGVSSRMDWTKSGSGACPGVLSSSFKSIFGYANSICELTGSMTTEKIENSIYANLDAGQPVLLGIYASNAGHAIVADGYGLNGDVVYTHLNLGWSGSYNAWYALPEVSAGGYNFTVVGSVIYNVMTNQTGELITGRILDDENDSPIEGAVVTAVNGSTTRTATSNANGIYALHVTSAKTWKLTVKADGFLSSSATSVTVGTSSSSGLGTINAGTYNYNDNGSIGNRWANDFVLAGDSVYVDEPAEVTNEVVLAVGESISFVNDRRQNPRQWLLGGSRKGAFVAANLNVDTEAVTDWAGFAKSTCVPTNSVVVTITGVRPGKESIYLGRRYKLKAPHTAVEYRVTVKR